MLSAVNGFLSHFDGGYGPRAGNLGILDPADALRHPYGYVVKAACGFRPGAVGVLLHLGFSAYIVVDWLLVDTDTSSATSLTCLLQQM